MSRAVGERGSTGDAIQAAAERAVAVSMVGVRKTFSLPRKNSVVALSEFSLQVGHREFAALIGPSGCGKSTALRMAAGLVKPDVGLVRVFGRDPLELVRSRGLGVAFQEHALLPWLTVWGNVALPFRIAGRLEDGDRIAELLKIVGLEGFENARPRHLSGGMLQRVSMARALALEPSLLLLDEPFGSLDAVTRRRLNVELQRIWAENAISTLLVTHSVEEAVFLSDRVLVMSSRPGRVRFARDVPFARPRLGDIMRDSAFRKLTDELTLALDEEQEVV